MNQPWTAREWKEVIRRSNIINSLPIGSNVERESTLIQRILDLEDEVTRLKVMLTELESDPPF